MDKIRKQILSEVLRIVSQCTGVTIQEIKLKARLPEISNARFMYCAIMRRQSDVAYTLDEIGSEINYNHSMVLHGDRMTSNYYETEKQYRECYDEITQGVKNSDTIKYLIAIHREENLTPNKDELIAAITLIRDKIKLLEAWLTQNHKNNYRQSVQNDIRKYEREKETKEALLKRIETT